MSEDRKRKNMENNGGAGGGAVVLFSDEEARDISGFQRCDDYVIVTCGCTSHTYGDAVGILRVFASGELEIRCECTPGCQEDKLTPAAFEKHSGRETARKWKNNIWVIVDGEKVPIFKTALLKYYNEASKHANGSQRSTGKTTGHRDEFIRCSQCNKLRRFRLRNKEECQIYHDAFLSVNWTCCDMPHDNVNFYCSPVCLTCKIRCTGEHLVYEERITCDDDEERASRRVYRGCTRSPTCKGCTTCVCFGCQTCRFSGCCCQTCMDFTTNAKS